jgi:uncharacterized protein
MALISVWLKPGASRSEIVACEDGVWHIKVTARAVEGKANQGLLELLSGRLRLPKSRLEIIRGQRGRRKQVSVDGLSDAEVSSRLGSD